MFVMNITFEILLAKNGWRETDSIDLTTGRDDMSPAISPETPTANPRPILPKVAIKIYFSTGFNKNKIEIITQDCCCFCNCKPMIEVSRMDMLLVVLLLQFSNKRLT